MSLNELADAILSKKTVKHDEVQSRIHPEIMWRYNSVNLLIGRRGSGKTYFIGRELLKLALYPQSGFTQCYYITDKERDDTFNFIQEEAPDKIEIIWCKTENGVKVAERLAKLKTLLTSEQWRQQNPEKVKTCEKALHIDDYEEIPHTLVVFDDCQSLFRKDTTLSKKLFENRQSRITYILSLQDIHGLSASMKANIDSLTLFGGFPKDKFSWILRQTKCVEGLSYDYYKQLALNDYCFIDFIDETCSYVHSAFRQHYSEAIDEEEDAYSQDSYSFC